MFTFQCSTAGPMPRMACPAYARTNAPGQQPGVDVAASVSQGRHDHRQLYGGSRGSQTGDHVHVNPGSSAAQPHENFVIDLSQDNTLQEGGVGSKPDQLPNSPTSSARYHHQRAQLPPEDNPTLLFYNPHREGGVGSRTDHLPNSPIPSTRHHHQHVQLPPEKGKQMYRAELYPRNVSNDINYVAPVFPPSADYRQFGEHLGYTRGPQIRTFHRDQFLPIDPTNLRAALDTFCLQLDLNQVLTDSERLRAALVAFPQATTQTFLYRYGCTGLSFKKFVEFIKTTSPQLFACHKSSSWARTPGVAELEALAEQSANCPHEELVKHFMWLHCPRWAQREAKEALDLPLCSFKQRLMTLLEKEGTASAPVYSSHPVSGPSRGRDAHEPFDQASDVAVTRPLCSDSSINRADVPETSQQVKKARRRRRRGRGSRNHAHTPSQPQLLTPPSPCRQHHGSSPSSGFAYHVQTKAEQVPQLPGAAHAKLLNNTQQHQQRLAKRRPPPLPTKRAMKQELKSADVARAKQHKHHHYHQQSPGRAIAKQHHLMADQWCLAAKTSTQLKIHPIFAYLRTACQPSGNSTLSPGGRSRRRSPQYRYSGVL